MWSKNNAERVEIGEQIASIHFTYWQKQSPGVSKINILIARITTVSMLMDFIIP